MAGASSRVYGVASLTGATGLTGAVLNDFTITASANSKTLSGNPSSSIVDARCAYTGETMTINVAFSAYVEPDTLIGDSLTLTATSEATESIAAAVTGIVTNAECRGSKEDWWTYSITIAKSATE